jgi:uncharacterized membrane protein
MTLQLSFHCMVLAAFSSMKEFSKTDQNKQTKEMLMKKPKGGVKEDQGVKVEQSIIIRRPADELFSFWEKLENLPKFMSHLKSVHRFADGQSSKRSHWVATTLAGLKVEWDAEIINEHENELISWQSLPGSEVDCAGSVRFRELENGDATEIKVNLKYDPPGGKATIVLSRLFKKDAASEIEEDLSHFKQIMETGEFALADVRENNSEPLTIN